MKTDPPNPGSIAAQEQGCTCPVIDNRYGEGIPHRDGPLFWFTAGCPLHTQDPSEKISGPVTILA